VPVAVPLAGAHHGHWGHGDHWNSCDHRGGCWGYDYDEYDDYGSWVYRHYDYDRYDYLDDCWD